MNVPSKPWKHKQGLGILDWAWERFKEEWNYADNRDGARKLL